MLYLVRKLNEIQINEVEEAKVNSQLYWSTWDYIGPRVDLYRICMEGIGVALTDHEIKCDRQIFKIQHDLRDD